MVGKNTDSRVSDLLRAETDIASIKKLIIQIATAAFASVLTVGVWVGTIETKVNRLDSVVATMEKEQHETDILAARIETKLLSIEATLAEIKMSVRK